MGVEGRMRVRNGINWLTTGPKCEHSGKLSGSSINAGSFLNSWIILNFYMSSLHHEVISHKKWYNQN